MQTSRGVIAGRNTEIFDLEQPRFRGMPIHEAHQPGYLYALHRRHTDSPPGPRSSASGMIVAMEHSGTHIDALCHQAEKMHMHGGISATSTSSTTGFSDLGVEHIEPIVAPGVLLDIPGYRNVDSLRSGDIVTGDELASCASSQGVELEPDSVVLVRTGIGRFWNEPETFLPGPGMDGSASHFMVEKRVRAVGADNMAWDAIGVVDEALGCELPGHILLLVRAGIHIIENLYLEDLAQTSTWNFTFVCTPLKFVGATGSPVRPIALVDASS